MNQDRNAKFERRVFIERTILRYSIARERSDFETMIAILDGAESDSELQALLMEFEDSYIEEQEELRQEDEAMAPAAEPIPGIFAAAAAFGKKPTNLAYELDVDISVLTKLERRLIDPVTIPPRLITLLAQTLRRQADQIMAYLSQPPTLAFAAMYKSRRRPRIRTNMEFRLAPTPDTDLHDAGEASAPDASRRETFADAVGSSEMTEEQKRLWLGSG